MDHRAREADRTRYHEIILDERRALRAHPDTVTERRVRPAVHDTEVGP